VDDCSDVSQQCSVTAMPTFHLYNKGSKIAEVVGADINKVAALVRTHAGSSGGGFSGAGRSLVCGYSNYIRDLVQRYLGRVEVEWILFNSRST
jgi:hypothetical protein